MYTRETCISTITCASHIQIPSQSFPVRELLKGSMYSKKKSRPSSARSHQESTGDKSKLGREGELALVVFWQVGNIWSVVGFMSKLCISVPEIKIKIFCHFCQ